MPEVRWPDRMESCTCLSSKAFAAISAPDKDTKDWVEATSGFFDQDNRPIMLFDGVFNLCNGGVRFVRANDRNRTMRYEALQSEAGKKLLRRSGRDPDDISSTVLSRERKVRAYFKSDAVLRIMHHIDLLAVRPHVPEGFCLRQHREQSLSCSDGHSHVRYRKSYPH